MRKLAVVGIGPGNYENMTIRADRALRECDVIVGYTVYVDLVKERYADKEFLTTPMLREVERCEMALETARGGKTVAMICSGDSGIYGMAALLYELRGEAAEPEIEVMRFAGTWKDLGTWNTLTEAMDSHAVGEALFNEKCENVHVVNELDVPILCMGLKDVVVSASPEGILVSDKEQSSYIKPYVNTLDHRVMFAEKSWGSFKVIDIDKASMTIKVTLNAGHQMNYHSHQHRDEVWTVIAGKGKTIVDGMEQNVKAGDVITMSAGCRHTVIAETELKLIEVQLGEAIDVHDKQKFELEY